MPEDLRQIDIYEFNETVLHPTAVTLLVVMFLVLLAVQKRDIFVPLVVIGVLVTDIQRIVIAGIDLSFFRIMLLGVMLRMILRGELQGIGWSRVDSFVVAYAVSATVFYFMLWRTASALVNRLGLAFDIMAVYFTCRVYLQDEKPLLVLMRWLCMSVIVVSIPMILEQINGYNLFSAFGGVPEITMAREGRLRAQGAFSHPILAGTYGATILPVAWALYCTRSGRDRLLAICAYAGSMVMTITSASSGPVLTLAGALMILALWRQRFNVRSLVAIAVCMVVGLHIVMEAPVWHLISRVDIAGGSTGWHRYYLIDQTIRNFSEWAVCGVHTTGHWGWGLNDVTNMYVLQAVRGGLVTFLLFAGMLVLIFSRIGGSVRENRGDGGRQKVAWAWGAVIFAHAVSFIGVSYFGQMNFFFYLAVGVSAALPRALGVADGQPLDSRSPYGRLHPLTE